MFVAQVMAEMKCLCPFDQLTVNIFLLEMPGFLQRNCKGWTSSCCCCNLSRQSEHFHLIVQKTKFAEEAGWRSC